MVRFCSSMNRWFSILQKTKSNQLVWFGSVRFGGFFSFCTPLLQNASRESCQTLLPPLKALLEKVLDPILIANEAVEDYRAKKKKGCILKLDLGKAFYTAFYRVDWIFLEKVLKGKNFNPRWITWIMGRVKNPKYLVFINRHPRGRILASRGIGQGDPLSPFLFLLTSEVLSSFIHRLHKKEKFEGFTMGKEKIIVLLLQFADDTLIFCKYDDKMLENLRKTIELFEWCSGQKVNWEKSAICGI